MDVCCSLKDTVIALLIVYVDILTVCTALKSASCSVLHCRAPDVIQYAILIIVFHLKLKTMSAELIV